MKIITYYKILIIYGFIVVIVMIPFLSQVLSDYIGASGWSPYPEETRLSILVTLIITTLFLIYPLVFEQFKQLIGADEKLRFIPAIVFITFGVVCLVLSLIADTFVVLKYIGFPASSLIFFIYGISFLRNKSIINLDMSESQL